MVGAALLCWSAGDLVRSDGIMNTTKISDFGPPCRTTWKAGNTYLLPIQ